MSAAQEASGSPTSYALVLPPGWRRIPLRRGTEPGVRRVLDHAFEGMPRDEVFTYRRDLEARLWQRVADAREADGLDLYLPVELMHGISVPASILVSETRLAEADDVGAQETVLLLAGSGDGREVVDIDGAAGRAYRADRTGRPRAWRRVPLPPRRLPGAGTGAGVAMADRRVLDRRRGGRGRRAVPAARRSLRRRDDHVPLAVVRRRRDVSTGPEPPGCPMTDLPSRLPSLLPEPGDWPHASSAYGLEVGEPGPEWVAL